MEAEDGHSEENRVHVAMNQSSSMQVLRSDYTYML